MYRGTRDPAVGIAVEQALCDMFTDSGGILWISVKVPPRDTRTYNRDWPDIILPPEQVFVIDDMYNEIFLNAGAQLKFCHKAVSQRTGKQVIIGEEFDSTEILLARFLQYEHWKLFKNVQEPPLTEIYRNFAASGMTMRGYIRAMAGIKAGGCAT